MKIFIICCLLFIHVNMCIYIIHMFIESPYFSYYVAIQNGFRVSIRVSGIRWFSFGDGLSPESVFGVVLGFDFGFGCTETPPDPNPPRCHPYGKLQSVFGCRIYFDTVTPLSLSESLSFPPLRNFVEPPLEWVRGEHRTSTEAGMDLAAADGELDVPHVGGDLP